MKSRGLAWRSTALAITAIMVMSCTAVSPTVAPTATPTPSASYQATPVATPSDEPSDTAFTGNTPHVNATPASGPQAAGPGSTVTEGESGDRAAQSSNYNYYGYDRMDATKGPVTADGYVYWYATHTLGLSLPGVSYIYGAFNREYVWATGPVDCIYYKVTWNKINGSISVPPAASLNSDSVSDGMYRSCRSNGYDRPYYFTLGGKYPIDFSSRGLTSVVLTICYSNAPQYVLHCSTRKHYS